MTSLDDVLGAVRRGRVFDLGRPLFIGMPQSPNHPAYWHSLPRRHGDMVRADGGSAANDVIVMGTHVGTHIDALAHVSQDGRLFGDRDADAAQVGGRFMDLGIHTVSPMLTRGVVLDVPGALAVERCEADYEITPADLDAAVRAEGLRIDEGDVVLVRSGWGATFDDGDAYRGSETGTPGVGEEGARWLADRRPLAVGGDTIAFERIGPRSGHALLPAHRVLLVDSGVYIMEALALEELCAASAWEFMFVLSPLKFVGGTGSPVRPLAVVPG